MKRLVATLAGILSITVWGAGTHVAAAQESPTPDQSRRPDEEKTPKPGEKISVSRDELRQIQLACGTPAVRDIKVPPSERPFPQQPSRSAGTSSGQVGTGGSGSASDEAHARAQVSPTGLGESTRGALWDPTLLTGTDGHARASAQPPARAGQVVISRAELEQLRSACRQSAGLVPNRAGVSKNEFAWIEPTTRSATGTGGSGSAQNAGARNGGAQNAATGGSAQQATAAQSGTGGAASAGASGGADQGAGSTGTSAGPNAQGTSGSAGLTNAPGGGGTAPGGANAGGGTSAGSAGGGGAASGATLDGTGGNAGGNVGTGGAGTSGNASSNAAGGGTATSGGGSAQANASAGNAAPVANNTGRNTGANSGSGNTTSGNNTEATASAGNAAGGSMGTHPAGPLATATFTGHVVGVAPRRVDISDESGSLYQLHVDARTEVMRDGRKVGLRALQPGMSVRASFAMMGFGDERARTVDIQGANQGNSGPGNAASTHAPSNTTPNARSQNAGANTAGQRNANPSGQPQSDNGVPPITSPR